MPSLFTPIATSTSGHSLTMSDPTSVGGEEAASLFRDTLASLQGKEATTAASLDSAITAAPLAPHRLSPRALDLETQASSRETDPDAQATMAAYVPAPIAAPIPVAVETPTTAVEPRQTIEKSDKGQTSSNSAATSHPSLADEALQDLEPSPRAQAASAVSSEPDTVSAVPTPSDRLNPHTGLVSSTAKLGQPWMAQMPPPADNGLAATSQSEAADQPHSPVPALHGETSRSDAPRAETASSTVTALTNRAAHGPAANALSKALNDLGGALEDQVDSQGAHNSDPDQPRLNSPTPTLSPTVTASIKSGSAQSETGKIPPALPLSEDAETVQPDSENQGTNRASQSLPTPPASAAAYHSRLTGSASGSLQNLPTQPVDTPRLVRPEITSARAANPEQTAQPELAGNSSGASSLPATPYNLVSSIQAQLQAQAMGQAHGPLNGQALAQEQAAIPLDLASMATAIEGTDLGQGLTTSPETAAAAPQALNAAPLSGLSKSTVETTAQISAQILRKLEGRATRFDMTLTPESLGRVDVSLTVEADGQVSARLAFDNPAAAIELRGRVDDLRRQLADAGLNLSRDNLEFTDRNPQSGSGQGTFDQHQERRAFAGTARLMQEADLPPLTPSPASWLSPSLTPDRVDVKV